MSSLKKYQIIQELNKKYGIIIKSVHELNIILEEMGIQKHFGNGWGITDKGIHFTIYNCRVLNANLWREKIVPEIAKYLSNK